MLLSRTSKYSLQALIYLARLPPGKKVLVRKMAQDLDLPMFFLAKLLQPLIHAGWLESARGRHGGVCLCEGAGGISLLEILRLTERNRLQQECLLGLKNCEDASACVMHCQWKPIKQELNEGFGKHNLATLASTELPSWLTAIDHSQ